MYVNYHTHTMRCNHASGTEEEYIQQAIANGVCVLGFADHAPMPFHDGHYSGFRMTLAQFPEYIESLLALREKYRGKIELLIGLETEYYPDVFADLLKLVHLYPVDYMILGQHFLGNEEPGEEPCSKLTSDEKCLSQYVDQVIAGMRTGLFSYLAHPDLLHYVGDDAIYRREMTRLCQAAKEMNIPLELNMLGMAQGRHYPEDKFWQIAKECKNSVVLGCDAHSPRRVADPAEIERAIAYINRFGVSLLESIPLRPVNK